MDGGGDDPGQGKGGQGPEPWTKRMGAARRGTAGSY